MSWLNWVEDKAKEAKDKAGDVVDAVVPDPLQDVVRQAPAITNPITAIPTLLGIAGRAGNSVAQNLPIPGFQQGANLINWAANDSPQVVRSPLEIAQELGRGTGGIIQQAGRHPIAAANQVRQGATGVIQNPVQSALRGVSEAAQLADKPRQAVITDMGDQAYYIATHNGEKPNHGIDKNPYIALSNALPDSFLTRWANDPENWKQIKYVYEHGFDSDKDGTPDFQGGRAVWELYASKIGGVTKTLADIAFDPLNAVPGLGAVGKGVERLGVAGQIGTDGLDAARAAGIADLGSLMSRGANAVDRAQALPFELAGKAIAPIARPLGNAIGESAVGEGLRKAGSGLRDALGLRESEQSVQRGVREQVGDVLNRTPNLVSETEIPDWAVSVPATGKYEAVSNQEIRNFGGSYIVDPDGHPVPGTARVGVGANKQNRQAAKAFNVDGGAKPQGVASTLNAEAPTGPAATVGESSSLTGDTPQPSLIPTVGPNPETAPPHYLQTPEQRSAAIGEGQVSGLSPRASSSGPLIQNIVEAQRAVNPERAATYDQIIGIDPQTGVAREGSWADMFDKEQKSISAHLYDTLGEKVARGKIAAIEHTIGPQLNAFRSAFGQGISPGLRKSAQRPTNELINELETGSDTALAGLIDRAVYADKESTAKGSLAALRSYGKRTGQPWLNGGDVYQRIAQARETFRNQLKADLTPTPTSQTLLDTAADPAKVMPVTSSGTITPPAFLPPETSQAVLKRLGNDMRIDPEDVEFLSKVQGSMDKPLVDEYYDRLMAGMTEDQAKADIQKHLYPSGNAEKVRPGKFKTTMNKLGKVNTFARQNMQHNIANGLSGNLGDRLGNRMILFQEGKYGALAKSLDPRAYFHALAKPTSVKEYLSKETDPLLAGFGRDLPSTVVPEHLSTAFESKMGTSGDKLLIAQATAKRGKVAQIAGGTIFGNQRVADTRGAMEMVERSMLATNEIREMLPDKILAFQNELQTAGLPAGDTLRAIQERATSMRAPADFLKGGKKRTLQSFNAEDVLAVTGRKDLAESWSRATNSMYKQAGNEARRVFFAGAKRYGIDDKLGQVFFFHFWASRALAQQAKAMARSPRVLSTYYRMIQGAMHEADRNQYPATFRGLMHYWGDTDAGFYALWNPLGVLVPAMMFSDLTTLVDDPDASLGQKWYNRFSSAIPVSPMIQAAAAALGISDDTPSFTGTTRIQNIATDVMNFANARGIDLTHGGVIADPVATVTQRVLQQINAAGNLATRNSLGTYEPYNARSGKIDTIREVLINNLENELGPKEGWTPEQWQRFQTASELLSYGGGSNEDAKEAYRDYTSAALINRGMGSIFPQGSVLRYGPREEARNADMPAANNERDLATVSPQMMGIEVGQQYLGGDAIGTERQRQLWDDWNNIVYNVADFDDSRNQQTMSVGGRTYTVAELKAMDQDTREALGNAFIASVGGTQEFEQFKDLRAQYIASNPSLATYREWQGNVRDYPTGVAGFRQWAATTSPAFKQAQDSSRAYYMDEYGLGGAALEAQLDDWATSPRAYAAFTGTPESVYDQGGGGADQATQAVFAMGASGGSGGGGGTGGSSQSIATRIRKGIDSYQERMAEYEAAGGPTTQMPGLFGIGQQQMYGAIPEPSDEVARFIAWSQRQPPGTDISPEAYEAITEKSK